MAKHVGTFVKTDSLPPEIQQKLFVSAQALVKEIRQRILDQVWDWPPLSDKYLQWKKEQGLDTRTLIATGYYVNAIEAWETAHGIRIGIRNKIHPEWNISLRLLGLWLEYGTYDSNGNLRMPPRPHFRPVILEWKNTELASLKQEAKMILIRDAQKRMSEALEILRRRSQRGE